jgi:hypothetical protein
MFSFDQHLAEVPFVGHGCFQQQKKYGNDYNDKMTCMPMRRMNTSSSMDVTYCNIEASVRLLSLQQLLQTNGGTCS